MSKRLPTSTPVDGRPPLWRSLGEKRDPAKRDREAVAEPAVQVPERSVLGRRRFMAISGATAAAIGLSGCMRRPEEHILPYSRAPEYVLPGIPLHYATTVHHRGEPVGLLVETHGARPTKIEGNPDHPASGGRTDAQLQALTEELYDPDRPATPLRGDERASWADFDAWWREKAAELEARGGQGLAVLAQPLDSPAMRRAREALQRRFPQARYHLWSPVPYTNARQGARLAFGQPLAVQIDFGAAQRVLALDCDFLGLEPGAIRNQRRWATQRRLLGPRDEVGRLYAVEGTLSVTGLNADHRLRLAPSRVEDYLRALATRLSRAEGVTLPDSVTAALGEPEISDVPPSWLDGAAEDLVAHRGRSAVCVGWSQPPRVHALAYALNVALGNVGRAVRFVASPADEPSSQVEDLRALTTAMREGEVDTLFILGGNPVYDAPSDLDFRGALEHVPTALHLSLLRDETSLPCEWFLPRAHPLESWGLHRGPDGTLSIQQPLIAPLRGGRSDQELLARIGGVRAWRGYDLVRAALQERLGAEGFERRWRQSLHRGVVDAPTPPLPSLPALREADLASALGEARRARPEGWEVAFIPSYQVFDGRFANLPWLVEMPDPVTKLVWDNAAYVSPASARELGMDFDEDEPSTPRLIELSREGATSLTLPVYVLPGQADHVITLPLGWGRRHVSRLGHDVGFDVYPFRTSDALSFATGVQVRTVAGEYPLVVTQSHHSMEGRPLAIDATLAEYRETPAFAQWRNPTPHVGPLWTQVNYSTPRPPAEGGTSYDLTPDPRPPAPDAPARYKWGFVVDLSTCTGCSACVVACQAENNVPTVGKRQVALGREMHWMRVDRYYQGEETEPRVLVQPVACQHCEEAPCENVCPVNATVHSPEGLNDMAYNRCIGTRYCMNNCPYKVRRFNFLDWHGDLHPLEKMKFNPNVTVRMRGVMEKCTYCVQRIQRGRIQARAERRVLDTGEVIERRIRDGEVVPSCAQACPSEAIVFGDLNDVGSDVHRMAHLDRQYELLASIGTQPRTTYLGRIWNPNPEMV